MFGLCHQITGEVVATKDNINSRNYVSGALALKDLEEFKTRKLRFIAYDVQPKLTESYKKDLRFLENHGFTTVISRSIDFSLYPNDGLVIRINNNNTYDGLGCTAHHPKGAIAVKERKEAVVTKLLKVIWQVGKSGRVTPVAILEPVDINGAIVSRATLNNVNFLESLDLFIGCNVEVIRSGEIIPTIVGRAP
jgi:DNA ligase (NAD+)